ncbi:hypothetical protein N6B72_06640 [Chryseobacterium soli]|uniref:hypothetical protein n=1 Tax=Chryseobacterium soli TaxID=445961 RepID=UPI0029547F47|nr:hypothetical protein [Chryseobacterium soli]MDV7696595.1 hypothetical protein [Chryseobacterium soli]
MKNLVFTVFVFLIVLTACSKKETAGFAVQEDVKVQYDTAAIDSFSNGAASMDVVRRIKMSSQAYQDSLKEAKKLQDQEKKLKEELEKDNKKKQEEEKKKTDEGKQKASTASAQNETKSE